MVRALPTGQARTEALRADFRSQATGLCRSSNPMDGGAIDPVICGWRHLIENVSADAKAIKDVVSHSKKVNEIKRSMNLAAAAMVNFCDWPTGFGECHERNQKLRCLFMRQPHSTLI
ncbi:MAG: hypothetical protein AAGB11_09735 [Pseudomonadota bacterium]